MSLAPRLMNPAHARALRNLLCTSRHSALMFGFSDFSLFAIAPTSIRFVGGFTQATTISPEAFASVLSD